MCTLRSCVAVWSSLLLLGVASGCGGGGGEKEVIPISGKVTCNGEPVTSGSVMFVPDVDPAVDGNPGKPASGALDENGEFVLTTYVKGDGVVIGKHRVSVIRNPTEEEIREADEEDVDPKKVVLCGGKNKSYEIKKGDTEIIIELTGRLEPGGDDDDDD